MYNIVKPKIRSISRKTYPLENVDRGSDGIRPNNLVQYNILKTKMGPIVGGVGVPGHPPNSHPTFYEEIKEAYIGEVDSIKKVETISKEITTEVEIKIKGISNDYGFWIGREENYPHNYFMKIIKFDPFEIYEEKNQDVSSMIDYAGNITTELKKPTEKTIRNIFKSLPPYYLNELGVKKTTATKYILPNGVEIYEE
ncbi:MAG: hypothetical protein J7L08_00530 [Candidatus Aenigmarchaeota archaeon]|nr:hypothetical protein [Candidatus Aenigmarchaeota archaeon]